MSDEELLAQTVDRTIRTLQTGDVNGANAIAQDAIDAGMEHPFLLKTHALWLNEKGRLQDALRTFHHARELAPEDPTILSGIAGVLAAMGEYDAALKILAGSLEIAPNLAMTHYLAGWCLENTGEMVEAQKAYKHTLSLRPDHVQALAGLASSSVRLEDFDTAKSSANRALSREPLQPTATAALAMTEIAEGDPAAAEARLRKLLSTKLPASPRAVALGVLGDALDAQEKTEEAFAAYSAEKSEYQGILKDRGKQDGTLTSDLQGMHANLTGTNGNWGVPQSSSAGRGDADGHVFLVGFPRSGTTLLEQVLASHPRISTLEEHDILAEPAKTYLRSADGIARLLAASDQELDELRHAYWDKTKKICGSVAGRVLVDKYPFNTAKLPLISRLFPHARIIFAIRDPRDVVFSNFRRHFRISSVSADTLTLEGTAHLYDATMKIGEWSRNNLPVKFHLHRHESLVADFEKQVRDICDFIGVDWRNEMNDFAASAKTRKITSMSASQVRAGLAADGVGRWKAYAPQLAPVMPVLAPWLSRFDYPSD